MPTNTKSTPVPDAGIIAQSCRNCRFATCEQEEAGRLTNVGKPSLVDGFSCHSVKAVNNGLPKLANKEYCIFFEDRRTA